MGFCVSSEERKENTDIDISTKFQGIKSLKQSSMCESKLVADRQTKELFILTNVYTESTRHANALKKDEALRLFDSLRKGKHLNMVTIWQVANSKLEQIFVV